MNERIKKLAEQAGLKIEYQMINPPKPLQILGGVEEFEKFAEMIVKECLDKVVEYETVKNGTPSYPMYDRIFKHFGVEL